MADTAEEVKTEKVFDLKEGKYVEKAIEEPKEPKEEPKNKPEESKENPPESTVPDYNKYLKDKFGADDEESLSQRLSRVEQLEKELEEAKKPKEYEFKSEKEKSIANFLKDWDIENIEEGYEMASRLMKMDPEKMNEKIALQEKFVIDNSDISRDKAIKLFNNEYNEKYVLDKEKYENEEEYKEAQELADIKREKQAVAAKKFLSEKKEALKYKEKSSKAEEKKPEPVTIPKETIDKYVGEVNKFFTPEQGVDFDRFTYESEKNPENKVTVLFTKEEVKNIKQETIAYLNSLNPYDKDKKIPNFDSGKLVSQVAEILYGDQIKERMLAEIDKLASTRRIEQLAGVKPDKKSGGGGKGKEGIPSMTEQFAELGKKAVADRQKKQ